jgi:hypothetical protein
MRPTWMSSRSAAGQLVVIDPRVTATAARADLHPAAAGDRSGAGQRIAAHRLGEQLVDEAFIDEDEPRARRQPHATRRARPSAHRHAMSRHCSQPTDRRRATERRSRSGARSGLSERRW